MPEDNQIRDAFNNSPLDNEDWLQPSDIVFDNIESELFGKKKRRWVVYWWIPLLSVLLLGALATYTFWPNTNNSQIATIDNNNAKIATNTPNTKSVEQVIESNENNSITNTEDNLADNTTQNKTAIQTAKSTNSTSNKSTASNNKKTNTHSSNSNHSNSATALNSNSQNKEENHLVQKTQNESFLTNEKQLTHTPITSNTHNTIDSGNNIINHSTNGLINTNISKSQVIELPIWDRKNKEQKLNPLNTIVSKIQVIELPLWDQIPQEPTLDLKAAPSSTTIDLPTFSPWALSISTAASFWNFKLNQDYRDALQAADFSHNVGKGFLVSLGLERKMTKVVSLKTQFSFERINFESGHNSGINYDPNLEGEDQENEFDLTMASPIGFLKSNISVERTDDGITEATELIVDLNNSHQITNLDWGLSGLVQLFNRSNFSSSIELGGGVQYLGNIKNELYQFSTSDGFNSKTASIIEDQNELNKIRPYAFGGINLGYQLGLKNSIQLQYQYKQDLQNIYEGGDFSTRLNRQQIGLSYKRNF